MLKKKSLLVILLIALFMLVAATASAQETSFSGSLTLGISFDFAMIANPPQSVADTYDDLDGDALNNFTFKVSQYANTNALMYLDFMPYEGDPDTGEGAISGTAIITMTQYADVYPDDPTGPNSHGYLFQGYGGVSDMFGSGSSLSLIFVNYFGYSDHQAYPLNITEAAFDLGMMTLSAALYNWFSDSSSDFTYDFADYQVRNNMTHHAFEVALSNIDVSPATISTSIMFFFYNTFGYDEYEADGGFYAMANDSAGGYGFSEGYNPWAMRFSVSANVALEGLGSIGFSEYFRIYGYAMRIRNENKLTATLDQLVDGLSVYIETGIAIRTGGKVEVDYVMDATGDTYEDVYGEKYTIPEVPLTFTTLPFVLDISYSMDMGGIALNPYLRLDTDVARMLSDNVSNMVTYGEDGLPDDYAENVILPWRVKLGANLGIGGDGFITIPIYLTATNITDTGQLFNYDLYGAIVGYPLADYGTRDTKVMFGFGLELAF